MATKIKARKIIVYTSPSCTWCGRLKAFLDQHRVRYKEVDISKNRTAADNLMRRTGQMGVPVTQVGKKFIIGFKQDELMHLLGL